MVSHQTQHTLVIPGLGQDYTGPLEAKRVSLKRDTYSVTFSAPSGNRTQGSSMATMNFTTKPMALIFDMETVRNLALLTKL